MALNDLFSRSNGRTRFFTASAAVAVSAAVVAGAVIYPGFSTANVDLNDGSVWVTNRSAGMVGHLNDQSKVLDGGFTATTTNFDVVQNAANVFMSSDSGSLLNPVNIPMMAMASETSLGGGVAASQGTNVMALTDSGRGKVWAMSNQDVPAFTTQGTKPILSGLGGAVSATAPDDTVYTADPQAGELITTTLDDAGKVASQKRVKVDGLAGLGDLQLTVAANKPVAFSAKAGKLFLPGGKQMPVANADGALLQQPSADGDFVAVETFKGLVTQPLDGSTAKVLALGTTGKAVAPVVQGSCVHAAWSGANKYVRSCGGSGNVVDIPKAGGQSLFVFRKNRDVVVLNDINSGNVWLVNQNMMLVNNWDDLKADLKKADNAEKDSLDPNVVNTLPDRTKPNRPPIAVPDSFGVRAGKTTILPVLFNDSDPDGDVLTVEAPAVNPAAGTVQAIYGGTGLQINVPANKTGASTFEYLAADGRGGTARAAVNLRVVPPSENSAPKPLRDTTFVVEQGQTVTLNMLSDWLDPEGDDIYLTGAKSDDGSAAIKTSPDGDLKYTDDGEKPGLKTMTITVSDGQASTQHKVKVNVKPAGSVPPVANADFYRAQVGEAIVLAPLKNDQDPAGGKLRLASVAKPANATVSKIADDGTVTFTGSAAGAVYLDYQVTNGPQSATGLIRVDVVAANNPGPPVAVKDLAMLPSGGSVLVDVLGNDMDPAGGVLVVQSVDVPPGSPVTATIMDRNVIKLTDVRGISGTLSVNYTISNGTGSAVGEISVIRIPAPDKLLPPRVEPDSATVRAGDIVSIPVLANDSDPNGEVLKSPVVVEGVDPSLGRLFTDQNQLRFIAGKTAKTVTGIYKVANSSGQYASAPVTLTIVAADPAHNQPPAPKNLTGRVIAGDKVKIPVPLDGIDPEGDSVELVGIDKAPTLGTAEIGNGYIFYTAGGSSAGTDSFTYRVRDRLGAEAIARVDVGIAPPLAVNRPPVTQDDYITIRPGRRVALDVALNDSDPDGGQIGVVRNGFSGPPEMKPAVDKNGNVVVTSPMEPGTATMMYAVADKFGAKATGNIRMTVTPDAPLRAPIARDDRVTVPQMLGKNTVDVPVLDNDSDPDGVTEALKVSLDTVPGQPASNASLTSKGVVRVPLTAGDQMIPYTVTDQDGLKATAVIWVPGLDKQYPVLSKHDVIRVTAGQVATLKLADYVKVRDGHTPRLTEASRISLLGAPSKDVITADGAGIRYAPALMFFGPGSITFEVTDGTGPDDPAGLKSTLTVMTLVDPAPQAKQPKNDPKKAKPKNTPPTFTGSTLDVPQQEDATLDVGPLAFDVDPGDKEKFKFSLTGNAPAGFKVKLSGSVLTVSQADGTRVGATGTVHVQVTDGTNPTVTADMVLTATSSSKPLAVANDDVVTDAHAGRTEVVKVLGNDVNPFPDTPLKVVGATVETGSAGITTTFKDDSVSVNTTDSYKGTVVVRYVVQDKTKDPDRYANGRIRITVKGRPDAPTKPLISEEKDKSVLLNWDAPADNGSPITKYTVAWAGGKQDCDTNTCTITGLTNATPYKFTVTATNAVGPSPTSPVSATATPDRMPDAPAAPTTTFGDGKVDVKWVAPVGDFSAVKSYNVQISPAPAGQDGQKTGVTGTSLTWPGLANGTEYQFRVQAVNRAPKPSDWGPYSVSTVPAGLPATPAAPAVQTQPAVGSNSQVTVSWAEPFINGAPITRYDLEVSGGGKASRVISTAARSQAVTVGTSTAGYQYRVRATNKAGTTAWGERSAPQRALGKVGTMSAPKLALVGDKAAGGQVQVSFDKLSAGQLNGYSASEVTYCVKLSTVGTTCGVPTPVTLAAPNGQAVYANVYAAPNSGAANQQGDASGPSNTATPYGVPAQVGVSGSTAPAQQKTVSWSWSAPNNNGNGITRYEYNLAGRGWTNAGGATSYSTGTGGYSESYTLEVRACNAGGCGAAGSATSTSGSAPPPPVTQWTVTNGTEDTCMDSLGSTNWDGRNCAGGHWLNTGDSMVTDCYVWRNSSSGHQGNWFHQVSGNAANNGLFARYDAFNPSPSWTPSPSMPKCAQGPGQW